MAYIRNGDIGSTQDYYTRMDFDRVLLNFKEEGSTVTGTQPAHTGPA